MAANMGNLKQYIRLPFSTLVAFKICLYIEHNHVNVLSSLKEDWCDHDTLVILTTVCNPEEHKFNATMGWLP